MPKMRDRRYYSRYIRLIYFAVDFLAVNFCLALAYSVHLQQRGLSLADFLDSGDWLGALQFVAVCDVLWFAVAYWANSYQTTHVFSRIRAFERIVKTVVLHFLLMAALYFSSLFMESSVAYPFYYEEGFYVALHVSLFLVIPTARMGMLYALLLYRKHGFNFRNVVIAGAGPVGSRIYKFAKADPALGYRVLGFFDDDPEHCLHRELVLGTIEDLKAYCMDNQVDEIHCALPMDRTDKIKDLLAFADDQLIRLRLVPDMRGLLYKKVDLQFFGEQPVFSVRSEPLESSLNKALKRAFDIAFSLAVLVLLFPFLLLTIGLLIKLESKGPLFFKQLRTGKDNKEFFCYKFRSMTVNKDSDAVQATKNDKRITKIGAFIRKTSIDEIPQFINVLLGDMSVVGPRPHMLKHTEQYSAIIKQFMVRHFVKPGITGWAQVNGYRGETKDPEMMRKRVEYDIWYLENWSLLLDVRIIFMTVFNIFSGEDNAY